MTRTDIEKLHDLYIELDVKRGHYKAFDAIGPKAPVMVSVGAAALIKVIIPSNVVRTALSNELTIVEIQIKSLGGEL